MLAESAMLILDLVLECVLCEAQISVSSSSVTFPKQLSLPPCKDFSVFSFSSELTTPLVVRDHSSLTASIFNSSQR